MNIENLINNLEFTNAIWQISGTLLFMFGDIITGLIQAVINHDVDSQKMREGILRKMLLIIVVALSFIVQAMFGITFVSKVVCIYLVLMEVVSIMENLKKANVDLGKLGEILKIKTEEPTVNLVIKKEDKK